LALNEAFDRKAVDTLLALDTLKTVLRLTGDGVLELSSLVARGLVEIREYAHQIGARRNAQLEQSYFAELSEKGKRFVQAWKAGDQEAAISGLNGSSDAGTPPPTGSKKRSSGR
jgi:hypothetical protein